MDFLASPIISSHKLTFSASRTARAGLGDSYVLVSSSCPLKQMAKLITIIGGYHAVAVPVGDWKGSHCGYQKDGKGRGESVGGCDCSAALTPRWEMQRPQVVSSPEM